MSIEDDIAEALGQVPEIQEVKPPPPVYTLQEQVALGEERRAARTGDLCPMCNMEMGEMKRARLRVGEKTWITCSVPCALFMFRRVVSNPRAESSVIEAVTPSRHNYL